MVFFHKKQSSETAILRCFRAYGLVTRTGIEIIPSLLVVFSKMRKMAVNRGFLELYL